MDISIPLFIHNASSVISIVAILGAAFFTFLNNPRNSANVAFSCMMLAVAVFTLSHVVGVNVADPAASQSILMLNTSIFFIAAFNLHAVMALIGKQSEKKGLIIFIYAAAVIFTTVFFIFPESFLLPSVPKMYFPNYYNPGAFNWVRVAFLYGIVLPYALYELYRTYSAAGDASERNRIKYFMLTLIVGYSLGFIPNFLVYNIPFDPLWGMSFAVFFVIPLAYGALKYGLFDIRVIAKQAFLYSVGVIGVGGLIILLNYATEAVRTSFPLFPSWATPLASSVLAVTIGILVWRRLRESDLLKYEFITTATHKFRTPLTHIKWAAENLLQTPLSDEQKVQIAYIQSGNTKLVELTDLLMNASEAENADYAYHIERTDLAPLATDALGYFAEQIEAKGIRVATDLSRNAPALCDAPRTKFVIQTLIENAVHYAQAGGAVSISIEPKDGSIVFTVTDDGIGISAEEIPLLFSKFYRGSQAKLSDTEGMGIGLFLTKQILEKQDGKIWVRSEGSGKGSSFSFSLPAYR